MKTNIVVFPVLLLVIQALVCACNSESKTLARIAEVEKKYQDSLSVLKDSITVLQKSLTVKQEQIELLSYPADQRMLDIKTEIANGQYTYAKHDIASLKKLFPHSKEASECDNLSVVIEKKLEEKRKEEERIKAQGFKAIAEQNSVKIDYNTVTLSGINVSNQFTFDSYGYEWHYREADRGAKYVSMQMSVTSSSHDPQLPELALYSISGDKMEYEGTFDTRFAKWKDYGAYLGNYHDYSNDFAKVSTVRFKLGLQVENEILAEPYAIVLKKENVLSSKYDRFGNPPVSYSGYANYPSTLSVDDFRGDYVIIKRYNLK